MTKLIKPLRTIPGVPGIRDVPGTPGTPPIPGHWITVTETRAATRGKLVTMPGRGNVDPSSAEYRIYGPTGRPVTTYVPGTPERTVEKRVWVPGSPGTPPTPGIPGVVPTPGSSAGADWDASAASIAHLAADGSLSFSVGPSVGIVCGLSSAQAGTPYQGIDFAWYIAGPNARPMEAGVFVGSQQAAIGTGTELKISRSAGRVTYFVDGEKFYESTGHSAGLAYARAALYAPFDAVEGATLLAASSQSAHSAGRLRALAGQAAEIAFSSSTGELRQIESESSGRSNRQGSRCALMPLSGFSADRSMAASAGALHHLEAASGSKGLVPAFVWSSTSMAPLNGAALGTSGGMLSSSATLRPLAGKSSDRPYAESASELAPLQGLAVDVMVQASYFTGSMPRGFRLNAQARVQPKNGLDARAPRAALAGFAGAQLRAKTKPAQVQIGGSFEVVGRARLQLPAPELLAAATMATTGTAALAVSSFGLIGFGGGTASAATPQVKLEASGRELASGVAEPALRWRPRLSAFAGAVLTQRLAGTMALGASASQAQTGAGRLSMPAPALEAFGQSGWFGAAEVMMPRPQLVTTPSGALLVMPLPQIRAAGGAALSAWSGAWVFGLGDSAGPKGQPVQRYAASQYTGYPFFAIVRFNGQHYGVSDAGLFLLQGDTDAGAPIAWAVESHISDFGSAQLKNMASVFVGAHMAGSAQAMAVVGERGSNAYSYTNVRGAPIQNHRVRFGRGMRSRYYGVRIEDEGGGDLHMDSLDLEVVPLSRKI